MQTRSHGKPERIRKKDTPVLHEEYESDLEEILSQIRNLQKRLNFLEKKAESQT